MIKLNTISPANFLEEMLVTSLNLKKLKLLSKALLSNNKPKTKFRKKEVSNLKSRWDQILQYTTISQTTRDKTLMSKLTTMLSWWPNKMRKINKIGQLFFFNVSWEEEPCKIWCSRVKKKDLILFLNWEQLKNGKQPVASKKREFLSRTNKKE